MSDNIPVEPNVSASCLPSNLEIEQALLGALLHHNKSFEQVGDFLSPQHFQNPLHGRIFEAISYFIHKNELVNPLILKNYFQKDEGFKGESSASYLSKLAGQVVSFRSVKDYAKQIYDLYLRRELILFSQGTLQEAQEYHLGEHAFRQIEKAEERLFRLATSQKNERFFTPFHQALAQALETAQTAFKRDSHVVGVTTGLLDLDKKLGGLHASDLVILAGRPSMGKTALATNIAFNAAIAWLQHQNKKQEAHNNSLDKAHDSTHGATFSPDSKEADGAQVAFFSLEMSSEQLALRLLGQESGISSDKIRRGAISHNDFPKFTHVAHQLSNLPLYIDDTPGITVAAIRARARRLQRQRNLGLIVIDYLQLVASNKSSYENRVQEISQITRDLKALAKELNVPILALSQLSRAVEQREDKRPQLADLRESGSIEQDADVVMFVYRQEYYESRKKPSEGETGATALWQQNMTSLHSLAEIIIAKQRHGPIGTIELHFNSELTKFSNISKASGS